MKIAYVLYPDFTALDLRLGRSRRALSDRFGASGGWGRVER